MRTETKHRIVGTLFLCGSAVSAYAQVKQGVTTIEVDTLTKVIGLLFSIGGIFLAYITMKSANQIAAVRAEFKAALSNVEEKIDKKLDDRIEKLENKINLSQKEIESRMATHHDIANLSSLHTAYGKVTEEQFNGIKDQLRHAAEMAATVAKTAAQSAAEAVREILKIERK